MTSFCEEVTRVADSDKRCGGRGIYVWSLTHVRLYTTYCHYVLQCRGIQVNLTSSQVFDQSSRSSERATNVLITIVRLRQAVPKDIAVEGRRV